MSKTKFHEVNCCTHFIPVKVNELFERSADITIYGKDCRMVVDSIYSFPIEDKPQKPVIPQFVVDWIEECKRDKKSLYYALESSEEVNRWLDRDEKTRENEDIFARAWLDGYEIEKEKLYTVEIPNPSHYWDYTFLTKTDGEVYIDMTENYCWKDDNRNHLTESEIKQDFDWAWQWAEPVEEKNGK